MTAVENNMIIQSQVMHFASTYCILNHSKFETQRMSVGISKKTLPPSCT